MPCAGVPTATGYSIAASSGRPCAHQTAESQKVCLDRDQKKNNLAVKLALTAGILASSPVTRAPGPEVSPSGNIFDSTLLTSLLYER